MSKSKIKLLIILTSFVIIACTVFSVVSLFSQRCGIRDIRIRNTGVNSFKVIVKYGDCSRYSVKNISTADYDRYYIGERKSHLPTEIGEYAVEIFLGDIDMYDSLYEKYPQHEVHSVNKGNKNIQWMWFNSDHGIRIIVGSDTPIEAAEQENDNPFVVSKVKAKIKVE